MATKIKKRPDNWEALVEQFRAKAQELFEAKIGIAPTWWNPTGRGTFWVSPKPSLYEPRHSEPFYWRMKRGKLVVTDCTGEIEYMFS